MIGTCRTAMCGPCDDDPVCGMPLPATHGYSEVREGTEYRFCSTNCLDKFDAEPAHYPSQKGDTR